MSADKIKVPQTNSGDAPIGFVTGTPNGTKTPMDVAVVGGVSLSSSALIAGTDYDYIDIQQTSSTVETFVFKLGGSGGSTIQTITVTYTDSTKSDLDSVAWS